MHVLLRLGWWVYMLILVSLFLVALLLNYIVKKINEARLEERLNQLREKASSTRASQVQRQQIEVASIMLDSIPEQSYHPTINSNPPVYRQDLQTTCNDDQIQIKNFPESKEVAINVDPTGSQAEDISNSSTHEMVQPAFLGVIYKDLAISKAIEKSKSLSSADCILDEVINKMVIKTKESQSTPSVKRVIDVQNSEDIKVAFIKNKDTNDAATVVPSTLDKK